MRYCLYREPPKLSASCYKRLKLDSLLSGRSIIAILEGWIDKHCPHVPEPGQLRKERAPEADDQQCSYGNAPMESFWGSLKNELVYHYRYATRADAEASIREYIEIFYNRQRRHSRLGYVAPAVFSQNLSIKQAVA